MLSGIEDVTSVSQIETLYSYVIYIRNSDYHPMCI